jgi:hypothetical protein
MPNGTTREDYREILDRDLQELLSDQSWREEYRSRYNRSNVTQDKDEDTQRGSEVASPGLDSDELPDAR